MQRAYFDNRKRDGHENVVVFFLEIKRSLKFDIFAGCRIGGTQAIVRGSLHYK